MSGILHTSSVWNETVRQVGYELCAADVRRKVVRCVLILGYNTVAALGCNIRGDYDPEQGMLALLDLVVQAWEAPMLLTSSVIYDIFGKGKLYVDQEVEQT